MFEKSQKVKKSLSYLSHITSLLHRFKPNTYFIKSQKVHLFRTSQTTPQFDSNLHFTEFWTYDKTKSHDNIIVEGDAKAVYYSLNGAMQPPQDIAIIVQDCQTLSLSFNSVCFRFVPPICNGAAHDIAHHALSIDEARVWDVCFPSWCLHSHQSDIGPLDPL